MHGWSIPVISLILDECGWTALISWAKKMSICLSSSTLNWCCCPAIMPMLSDCDWVIPRDMPDISTMVEGHDERWVTLLPWLCMGGSLALATLWPSVSKMWHQGIPGYPWCVAEYTGHSSGTVLNKAWREAPLCIVYSDHIQSLVLLSLLIYQLSSHGLFGQLQICSILMLWPGLHSLTVCPAPGWGGPWVSPLPYARCITVSVEGWSLCHALRCTWVRLGCRASFPLKQGSFLEVLLSFCGAGAFSSAWGWQFCRQGVLYPSGHLRKA